MASERSSRSKSSTLSPIEGFKRSVAFKTLRTTIGGISKSDPHGSLTLMTPGHDGSMTSNARELFLSEIGQQ